MNVLSLFDGMACGLTALKRAGIKVDNYFASEVDKYAIAIAKKNHPEIKPLGDIKDYQNWNLPKIDLIIGGPPCQGFSIIGKRLNWDNPKSLLFFKAIELIWDLKPKYFLIENVAKMKNEIQSELDDLIEIKSKEIDSALVSAQNRKRLYWTNIEFGELADKGILLEDILEENGFGVIKSDGIWEERNFKSQCIDANYHKGVDNHRQRTMILKGYAEGLKGYEINRRVYSGGGKSPTLLSCSAGGNRHAKIDIGDHKWRKLTPTECERLQTLPDNYTEGVSNTQRYKMIGNGWTVDVIAHILSSLS